MAPSRRTIRAGRADDRPELFAGLELLDPGVVSLPDWHPEETGNGTVQLPGMVADDEVALWAGVGIKP